MSRSNDADGSARGPGAWRDVFAGAFDLHAAAERLGVSTATVDEMVHRGELVAVRLGGASLLRHGSSTLTECFRESPGCSRAGRDRPSRSRCGRALPPGNCTAARQPRRSRIPRQTDDAKVSLESAHRHRRVSVIAASPTPFPARRWRRFHPRSPRRLDRIRRRRGRTRHPHRPRAAAGARRGDRTRRRPSRARSARRRVPRLVRHRDRGATRPASQGRSQRTRRSGLAPECAAAVATPARIRRSCARSHRETRSLACTRLALP